MSDLGSGIFSKVSNAPIKTQSAWLKDINGKACKLKAAWIIDANHIARQFFVSVIKAMAIAAFERGGAGSTTNDLIAYKSGSGYAVYTFPANDAFTSCQKLTLHFYIVSGYSTFGTIALRDGTTRDDAYGKNTGIASPVPDYVPTGNGWQSVDVTAALDADGGVTRAIAAENGIKVFMRSYNNSVIGGIGGAYCPYLTLDSAGSSPVEPDEPDTDISFTENEDGSVTLTNVAFTKLDDSTVQMDNATFTQQDDGSVLVQ